MVTANVNSLLPNMYVQYTFYIAAIKTVKITLQKVFNELVKSTGIH